MKRLQDNVVAAARRRRTTAAVATAAAAVAAVAAFVAVTAVIVALVAGCNDGNGVRQLHVLYSSASAVERQPFPAATEVVLQAQDCEAGRAALDNNNDDNDYRKDRGEGRPTAGSLCKWCSVR